MADLCFAIKGSVCTGINTARAACHARRSLLFMSLQYKVPITAGELKDFSLYQPAVLSHLSVP